MAVTASISDFNTDGRFRSRNVTVTMDSSYATGGTAYTPRVFGLLAVRTISATSPGAYKIVPDITNSKFVAYQELPTGTTQVSSGVDLSGVTFKAKVVGY